MKIERFRVQNYKNLNDVTVKGLSAINVLFGQNSVGKSNTFEALAIALWLLRNAKGIGPYKEEVGPETAANVAELCEELLITPPLTPLAEEGSLSFEITVRWESQDVAGNGKSSSLHNGTVNKAEIPRNTLLVCRIVVKNRTDMFYYLVDYSWTNDKGYAVHFPGENSLPVIPLLHIIDANRRLEIEQRGQGNGSKEISHRNLKRAIFYAYLSSDQQQKRRLESIRKILAEPPFELGMLDVALHPETDVIDIGFVRPDGRLPIENLGSGFQQLLLVLGQVFLDDSPLVALEEPEMNLSPQNQQHLLKALQRLMQDPAIALDQLFISTHSPYFEFAENFYDVTLDKEGRTQIIQAETVERDRYFVMTPIGPETGARLNSLNQIQLYQGVLDDLHLQRGDMIFFVKGDAGRWEIYPEEEVLAAMEEAWGDDGGDE